MTPRVGGVPGGIAATGDLRRPRHDPSLLVSTRPSGAGGLHFRSAPRWGQGGPEHPEMKRAGLRTYRRPARRHKDSQIP